MNFPQTGLSPPAGVVPKEENENEGRGSRDEEKSSRLPEGNKAPGGVLMYEVTLVNGSRQVIVKRHQTPHLGEVIFIARVPWRVVKAEFFIGGA
jgi:hypothetical protein